MPNSRLTLFLLPSFLPLLRSRRPGRLGHGSLLLYRAQRVPEPAANLAGARAVVGVGGRLV